MDSVRFQKFRRIVPFITSIIMILAITTISPSAVFAEDAVSFGGEDVKKKDTVYLGEWAGYPVS